MRVKATLFPLDDTALVSPALLVVQAVADWSRGCLTWTEALDGGGEDDIWQSRFVRKAGVTDNQARN